MLKTMLLFVFNFIIFISYSYYYSYYYNEWHGEYYWGIYGGNIREEYEFIVIPLFSFIVYGPASPIYG